MSKTTAWTALIGMVTVLASASFCAPQYLSDAGNPFFKSFVNHELLAFLGVVVTITLASAANLHLELNKLEERTEEAFPEARGAVRQSALSLLVLFCLAFLLVILKPLVTGFEHAEALLNSAVVVIVIFNLAVLADLTTAVFRIPAIKERR